MLYVYANFEQENAKNNSLIICTIDFCVTQDKLKKKQVL